MGAAKTGAGAASLANTAAATGAGTAGAGALGGFGEEEEKITFEHIY